MNYTLAADGLVTHMLPCQEASMGAEFRTVCHVPVGPHWKMFRGVVSVFRLPRGIDVCTACVKAALSLESPAVPASPAVSDCRSAVGETVGLIDAAIVTLRIASRAACLSDTPVIEALTDLRCDSEIVKLLRWENCKSSNDGVACDRTVSHTGDHCGSTPDGHTRIW